MENYVIRIVSDLGSWVYARLGECRHEEARIHCNRALSEFWRSEERKRLGIGSFKMVLEAE